MTESQDDGVECERPSAGRVAARAIVLAAVVDRGMIENEYSSSGDAEKARMNLLAWIREIDVVDEAEPEELALLEQAFGELGLQQIVDAIWRIEGLAVLLWALGLLELPQYDALVDPQTVWNAVRVCDAEIARGILQSAKLRTPEQLATYRTQATMINWRFRNQRLHPRQVDFVAMSRSCWIGSFDLVGLQIIDSDLAVGGAPICNVDPERLSTCESIANERHLAINWLTGLNSSTYSETDTST